jgi:hypothetical protein
MKNRKHIQENNKTFSKSWETDGHPGIEGFKGTK